MAIYYKKILETIDYNTNSNFCQLMLWSEYKQAVFD